MPRKRKPKFRMRVVPGTGMDGVPPLMARVYKKKFGNRFVACMKYVESRVCTGCDPGSASRFDVEFENGKFVTRRGLGCHECGYTGRKRTVLFLPFDGHG